jgi:hypothetical protein
MGQFAIVISGVGGHGCSREVKNGEHVLGCQRPDCPDCIAREFVRRFKRNNVTELRAELIHWPVSPSEIPEDSDHERRVLAQYALVFPSSSSVVDDLVTGERHGSF